MQTYSCKWSLLRESSSVNLSVHEEETSPGTGLTIQWRVSWLLSAKSAFLMSFMSPEHQQLYKKGGVRCIFRVGFACVNSLHICTSSLPMGDCCLQKYWLHGLELKQDEMNVYYFPSLVMCTTCKTQSFFPCSHMDFPDQFCDSWKTPGQHNLCIAEERMAWRGAW